MLDADATLHCPDLSEELVRGEVERPTDRDVLGQGDVPQFRRCEPVSTEGSVFLLGSHHDGFVAHDYHGDVHHLALVFVVDTNSDDVSLLTHGEVGSFDLIAHLDIPPFSCCGRTYSSDKWTSFYLYICINLWTCQVIKIVV